MVATPFGMYSFLLPFTSLLQRMEEYFNPSHHVLDSNWRLICKELYTQISKQGGCFQLLEQHMPDLLAQQITVAATLHTSPYEVKASNYGSQNTKVPVEQPAQEAESPNNALDEVQGAEPKLGEENLSCEDESRDERVEARDQVSQATSPAPSSQTKRSITKADKDKEEVAEQVEELEDEYVLLDLEDVFHGAALPANCPYTLSGLDTMNPILTLGDGGLKLIGEYEDTVGTCLIFTEHEAEAPSEGPVHPNEASSAPMPNQDRKRSINTLCRLEKKLKFRIMNVAEKDVENVQ